MSFLSFKSVLNIIMSINDLHPCKAVVGSQRFCGDSCGNWKDNFMSAFTSQTWRLSRVL